MLNSKVTRNSVKTVFGGGTGFIGKRLCNVLKKKGYKITVLSRMPGPQQMSWNELHAKGLPKNTAAVINLAGQNVMDFTRRWTAGFKQNVFNSRINTTMSLATMINMASQKPSVFVTMSGVGVYKPDKDKEYTETSTCESFDFFSKLCKNWEKAASLTEESQKHCRVVTIRSGVVLGEEGGMIKQLYIPFYLGLGGPVGNGSQYMPWIHIDDLANLIVFAVENRSVQGVLNGVAPKPCTNKDFSKAFAKALNRPAFFPLPSSILNILLGKERAVMITKGQKVLPKKTQSVGFNYKYPNIELACKAVVKGIRKIYTIYP